MKGLKNIGLISLLLILLFSITVGCSKEEVLNIYTWADNFDDEVIKKFEKEFGVKVTRDTYSSNEDLLAKLQAGGAQYDIIQPSDYMVTIMTKLGLLEELNKENIPNFDNLNDAFKSPSFDPESKYSIVYTYGVTGIAYNKKYIKEEIDSWEDLWNPKYKGRLVLLNDSREVYGMALKKLGYSNNSTDPNELEAAHQELKKLLPNVLAFDTDNIKQKFIAEEAWIGTMWSGDAAFTNAENSDIAYVVPKEGGTIWYDTIAIPKGAKHKELAEKFINFILEPEISAQNYEYIGYSNPNEKAIQYHSEEYRSNPMIFLTKEELERTEALSDVGEALQIYDRLWTELKSGNE